MKKLMILGGSTNQMPLIKCARQRVLTVSCFVIIQRSMLGKICGCFYCVSTLDKESVLDAARKENIDGIVTNSEPAMPTAAYVGNKLGLLSNPYESIVTLCRKDLFRNFLKNNGFNCPQSYNTGDYKNALEKISGFKFPLMVKPVDSSGSRGVNRIYSIKELKAAFDAALGFSKVKRVIIEEYIESTHDYMIGGDIFVLNGEVVFWGLMNSMRDNMVNEFVPVGTSFPSFINHEQFTIIKRTIKAIIDLMHINLGPFNLELMFTKDNQLFVIRNESA